MGCARKVHAEATGARARDGAIAVSAGPAYLVFITGNCQRASVAERGLRSRLNTGTGATHADHASNLGCL
jgi:hypothetical protein